MSRPLQVVVGLLLLAVGYGVGHRAGQGWERARDEATAVNIEAQVRYLLDRAYPGEPGQWVDVVPPSKVMMAVQQNRKAPEVVRAILYDEVYSRFNLYVEESNNSTLPRDANWERSYRPIYREYAKRVSALQEWIPGQTGPVAPRDKPIR